MSSKKHHKILITAGPTREMIDPVRFLSNLSTGEMGYSLAKEAVKEKHQVTLVSGPTGKIPPRKTNLIHIVTSKELRKVCEEELLQHDILIMSAAVSDYTPVSVSESKIKRHKKLEVVFKQTDDILLKLSKIKKRQTMIGFCLETEDWIETAKRKIKKKKLDGIVANYYIPGVHDPFGKGKKHVALIDRFGKCEEIKGLSKPALSKKIIKWAIDLRKKQV